MTANLYTTEDLNIWDWTIPFQINRGDHLAVVVEITGSEHLQHGIFLGVENGVADFGDQPRIVNFVTFINTGTRRRLIRINHQMCLPPEDSVQNAHFLICNPQCSQDWLRKSSEQIATDCKTSAHLSSQIKGKIAEYQLNPNQFLKEVMEYLSKMG